MSLISKTPGVMGGRACVDGTRIPVASVVSFGAAPEAMAAYPVLTRAQVDAAFAYAAVHPEELVEQLDECCEKARDVALEEAARFVDGCPEDWEPGRIADRIRAMKKGPTDGE